MPGQDSTIQCIDVKSMVKQTEDRKLVVFRGYFEHDESIAHARWDGTKGSFDKFLDVAVAGGIKVIFCDETTFTKEELKSLEEVAARNSAYKQVLDEASKRVGECAELSFAWLQDGVFYEHSIITDWYVKVLDAFDDDETKTRETSSIVSR